MRNIFIITATQVVTSESHPEGLLSMVSGYPKIFDSTNYNNDVDATLKKAKAEYFDRLSKNYDDTNPVRVMKTVMLHTASGEQLLMESIGVLSSPEPEPNPEPEDA